jgi:hypothetical protein
MKKGDTWTGAYQGHAMVRGSFRETGVWDLYSDRTFIQMDPFTKGEIQKEMMKERFAEEVRYLRMLSWVYYYFFLFQNPGFDFSGAEFSGSAPDPRKFMGGVKYN